MARKASKTKKWEQPLSCVGLRYRTTLDGRDVLSRNVPFAVTLEREPDNEHDPNAIRVHYSGGKLKGLMGTHLGYLRRDVAALLAPFLDDGSLKVVKGEAHSLEGDQLDRAECLFTFEDYRSKS